MRILQTALPHHTELLCIVQNRRPQQLLVEGARLSSLLRLLCFIYIILYLADLASRTVPPSDDEDVGEYDVVEAVEEPQEKELSPSPEPTPKRTRKPSRKAYVFVVVLDNALLIFPYSVDRMEAMSDDDIEEIPNPTPQRGSRLSKTKCVFSGKLRFISLTKPLQGSRTER